MRLLLIKTGVRAPGSSKVLRPEALEDNRVKLMDFGVSSELHHLRMVVFVVFFFLPCFSLFAILFVKDASSVLWF